MQIEELVSRFEHTFNSRNAEALGALFTDDAEFVNMFGARFHSRADIIAKHAMHFSKALAGTALRVGAPEIRPLGGDTSLVHAAWHRERLADAPEGTLATGDGVLTFVAVRRGADWQFAAAVNVQTRAMP